MPNQPLHHAGLVYARVEVAPGATHWAVVTNYTDAQHYGDTVAILETPGGGAIPREEARRVMEALNPWGRSLT